MAPPDFQAISRELLEFGQRLGRALPALRGASDVEVGCSAKQVVWSSDKITLYRYEALAKPRGLPPLLVCYALVNRPYMMDLQPDRSLIRALLATGLDVYLIDWGYPDGADRFLSLDDYINGYLDECVRQVLATHAIDALNLLGVCQGGTFSLCYAATHPGRIRNLITMVTPVDFKTPENLLSKWAQGIDVDLMIRGGNVPGELLNAAFLSLMPFRLVQQKYLGLADIADKPADIENFMRMERWIFDSPDQAATAFGQFLRWFFQENRLIENSLQIGGQRVELRNITQPILNLYGLRDHLVPPSATTVLAAHVGTEDYTAAPIDTGHIGMYVSGTGLHAVPAKIVEWLSQR